MSDGVYSWSSSSSLNEPNWVRDRGIFQDRHGKRDRAAYVNATRRQVWKYGIKFEMRGMVNVPSARKCGGITAVSNVTGEMWKMWRFIVCTRNADSVALGRFILERFICPYIVKSIVALTSLWGADTNNRVFKIVLIVGIIVFLDILISHIIRQI